MERQTVTPQASAGWLLFRDKSGKLTAVNLAFIYEITMEGQEIVLWSHTPAESYRIRFERKDDANAAFYDLVLLTLHAEVFDCLEVDA